MKMALHIAIETVVWSHCDLLFTNLLILKGFYKCHLRCDFACNEESVKGTLTFKRAQLDEDRQRPFV